MKISHERLRSDISADNTFIAREDDGTPVGACTVQPRRMGLFPDMPRQYVIEAEGDDRALHVLYGAAVARARALAAQTNAPARVYAEVGVGDERALEVLHALGFSDGDGVVRTYRRVTGQMNVRLMPEGCTIVRDFLADETERRFFLERYNACFGMRCGEEWLEEITSQPDFARILMVSPDDLCGELLVWTEDGEGVIGIIQTARRWRRQGVASYLIEDARLDFASLGLSCSHFDVWLEAPGCLPLARGLGYTGEDPLMLYPSLIL